MVRIQPPQHIYQKTRAIILAAGKGKRLNSEKPKAPHDLCKKPLISYILDTCAKLNIIPHIVIGHQEELVREALGKKYIYAEQKEQLGTAMPYFLPYHTWSRTLLVNIF